MFLPGRLRLKLTGLREPISRCGSAHGRGWGGDGHGVGGGAGCSQLVRVYLNHVGSWGATSILLREARPLSPSVYPSPGLGPHEVLTEGSI